MFRFSWDSVFCSSPPPPRWHMLHHILRFLNFSSASSSFLLPFPSFPSSSLPLSSFLTPSPPSLTPSPPPSLPPSPLHLPVCGLGRRTAGRLGLIPDCLLPPLIPGSAPPHSSLSLSGGLAPSSPSWPLAGLHSLVLGVLLEQPSAHLFDM